MWLGKWWENADPEYIAINFSMSHVCIGPSLVLFARTFSLSAIIMWLMAEVWLHEYK